MRRRQLGSLLALSTLVAFTLLLLRRPTEHLYIPSIQSAEEYLRLKPAATPAETVSVTPAIPATSDSHPIHQLISKAEQDFETVKAGQSRSLSQAVTEYKRRYNLNPPPNFDKWYEFAVSGGVQLIDEYDSIYQSLLPFWALEPQTIRERVREAIGSDNALMAVLLRGGKITKVDKGGEWQQNATRGMMHEFAKYLPDMDLAFNLHDEPRVVVPVEDLARLVERAKSQAIPAAFANSSPINQFSSRPEDVNDGKRIAEYKTTRFNVFAHQPTWTHSRLSCSPDSPARSLEEEPTDNFTSYALGELGFVYNHTAFSDICMSPSFATTFGFFDRPNAFNIVLDLFPIFSQSKISSFQDILYPSPWYWYGKVQYDEDRDLDWQEKADHMYWRGSTTGGFSRNGGWRRQHRQRFVQKMNARDKAKVLKNQPIEGGENWQVEMVSRHDYKSLFDVRFSGVGQCDPGDCEAQLKFFDMAEPAEQQDAWQSKYLLDIDGNAFSGRFYAFLKSKSLVYKMAIFREWHQEWLRPWVHYIPLSLKGDDWLESVRYFAAEEEGKRQAPRIAMKGREWADRVLRNEDFEVWFFRLLLEYGRLVDDNRDAIGFVI